MEAFHNKGLIIGKTNQMISGCVMKGRLSKSKVFPYWICGLRVEANSVLCVQCGKWIHSRFSGLNRVTP